MGCDVLVVMLLGVWSCHLYRLCNYDKDYLLVKDEEKAHGSQKLLHWSAKAVSEWVCSIELEQHAPSLDKTGIHGPVMVCRWVGCHLVYPIKVSVILQLC